MKNFKLERVDIKNHPSLNEKWLQDCIAEDPQILGLGDLVLRDRERVQPKAGRLDLLFQESESGRRYEVEIQLGRTDESHIIRCIEYWDLERKRYPQYDHCAVIIAEDITSRFLNVISLFNGTVPLIAIQVQAFKVENGISLIFTTVMDELSRGLDDHDEDIMPTDRKHWDRRGTNITMGIADQLLKIVQEFDPSFKLNYNKSYIGLERNGQAFNFATFKPRKSHLNLDFKLDQNSEVDQLIEKLNLNAMDYIRKWELYRIRLSAGDLKKHEETIRMFLRKSYDYKNS